MSEDIVSEKDAQLLQHFATLRDDKFSFTGWVAVAGKKTERRILCVGEYRIYLVKPSKKKIDVEQEAHLLTLTKIKSPSPQEIYFDSKSFSVSIKTSRADEILNAIKTNLAHMFPHGVPEEFNITIEVTPPSRNKEPDKSERPCGNYSAAYAAFCTFHGVPVRADIIWDVDHLFPATNITTFNLKEFEHPLTPSDFKCLLSALKFNSYFKEFHLRGVKLDKEQFAAIVDCMKVNKAIESLTLVNVTAPRDQFAELANALTINKMNKITSVDLSHSQLEDKGLIALSSWIASLGHGLQSINIENCGARKQGLQAFGNALKKNIYMASSLTYLNISGNKLESEGSNALMSYLANPNPLQRFLMKNTSPSLDLLIEAVNRGCSGEIREFDISDNKMNKKDMISLTKLCQASASLRKLNLSGCGVPVESLRDLLLAIAKNVYMQNVELELANNGLGLEGAKSIISVISEGVNIEKLDLSDNDFGDEGMYILAEGLCFAPALKSLAVSRNMKDKGSRSRSSAIEGLINLISSECPLDTLILQGGKGYALGQELIPLIDAIGTNDSITSLDISGNNIGNKGAMALAKAIQTNQTLVHLVWDENGTTLPGFQNFKVGLQRNHTLKTMPLPLVDIHVAMGATKDEYAKKKLLKVISEIEELILSHHSSKSKFAQKKMDLLMGGQFSVYSSSQREEIDRMIAKIKAAGKPTTEHQNIIKEAANYEQVVAALHSAKIERFELLGTELTKKLKTMVKDVEPIVTSQYSELKKQMADILTKKFKSLEGDIIQKIQSNVNSNSRVIEPKIFEDILVRAAGGEIGNKVDECFTNAVDLCSDFLFEQLLEVLENILAEVKEGISKDVEEASGGGEGAAEGGDTAHSENAESDSKLHSESVSSQSMTTTTATTATTSMGPEKKETKEESSTVAEKKEDKKPDEKKSDKKKHDEKKHENKKESKKHEEKEEKKREEKKEEKKSDDKKEDRKIDEKKEEKKHEEIKEEKKVDEKKAEKKIDEKKEDKKIEEKKVEKSVGANVASAAQGSVPYSGSSPLNKGPPPPIPVSNPTATPPPKSAPPKVIPRASPVKEMAAAFQTSQANGTNSSPAAATTSKPVPGKVAVPAGLLVPKVGLPPPRIVPSAAQRTPPPPTVSSPPAETKPDKKDIKKEDKKKDDKKTKHLDKDKKKETTKTKETKESKNPPVSSAGAVDLSQLPETTSPQLTHPTMDRPRIQKRRRPPTRRPRPNISSAGHAAGDALEDSGGDAD